MGITHGLVGDQQFVLGFHPVCHRLGSFLVQQLFESGFGFLDRMFGCGGLVYMDCRNRPALNVFVAVDNHITQE